MKTMEEYTQSTDDTAAPSLSLLHLTFDALAPCVTMYTPPHKLTSTDALSWGTRHYWSSVCAARSRVVRIIFGQRGSCTMFEETRRNCARKWAQPRSTHESLRMYIACGRWTLPIAPRDFATSVRTHGCAFKGQDRLFA